MPETPTATMPSPMGIHCPDCKSPRLRVRETLDPCPGVRVRYRRCLNCACVVRTREIIDQLVRHGQKSG